MTGSAPTSFIDHLAVVAPTLEGGCDAVARWLGVRPAGGGAHLRMGTHNRLLRLGADVYLEVIAIDPAAASPGRPRWFELDGLAPDQAPRLANWAARTNDIDASLAAAAEPLGVAEPMSRGELRWRISIPPDGALPLGGPAPTLIEWAPGARHPASSLPDQGCQLVALTLRHPQPERLRSLLDRLRLDLGPVRLAIEATPAAGLSADILTPSGLRTLAG